MLNPALSISESVDHSRITFPALGVAVNDESLIMVASEVSPIINSLKPVTETVKVRVPALQLQIVQFAVCGTHGLVLHGVVITTPSFMTTSLLRSMFAFAGQVKSMVIGALKVLFGALVSR